MNLKHIRLLILLLAVAVSAAGCSQVSEDLELTKVEQQIVDTNSQEQETSDKQVINRSQKRVQVMIQAVTHK